MSELKKEEYEEPRCVLCMDQNNVTPIPVVRVTEKLDSYLNKKDYAAAERHLAYWLREAEAGSDTRGALAVRNEQIGLYRKLGKKDECLAAAEAALSAARAPEFDGTVTRGTTFVNAATAYKAFGLPETGIPLYREAQILYERYLKPDDCRLGGLYNNMALALAELNRFSEARAAYEKALEVMSRAENGEAELAITCLNLADLCAAKQGFEEGEAQINGYLDRAEAWLDTESLPHDAYYAFVCEKCAPVFGYYGRFLTEEKYSRLAKEIYAAHGAE